jgi:hypothetical protein
MVVGRGGDPPSVVKLEPQIVFDDLVAAAKLDPIDVRQRLPVAWARARDAGELTGLRNVGLFSSHYLRARAPRLDGWDDREVLGRGCPRGDACQAAGASRLRGRLMDLHPGAGRTSARRSLR